MNSPMIRLYMVLTLVVMVVCGCDKQAAPGPAAPAAPMARAGVDAKQEMQAGAALFKQYCFPCHPDGGNVSNPERTLHGSSLRSNHISRAEDIIRIMRHPISRMIRFDESTISDKDARTIAEYVLKAFSTL